MKNFLLIAAAIGAAVATAQPTQAATVTITTLPAWNGSSSISSWGGAGTNTYGEVIDAPTGATSLTAFTFQINNGNVPGSYVAQVYDWSGNNFTGGQVGSALYTGPLTALPGFNGFQAVTVNTGGVAVTAGNRYGILLYDNSPNGVSASWGFGPFFTPSGVPGDVGFFFNNGPSNANGTFSNFGSLAFSASFETGAVGGIPEPGSWAMMIAGFGLVGAAARRRRTIAIA